ncbi:hypothetical protein THAOC_11670 [Thalassiosira oceanica]|uniref:Uncharacterized protein n=1 Tax=Thalassiosira oceanica TaxID=159749 RepID=K0SPS1_THAOC|nr:hypothetical protein THAOC_11670 [Thalassiosira oceanica]|eukprot:EJK67315.1 hypothetical protein THAOC_11670 [Thalassiosira oceanica]
MLPSRKSNNEPSPPSASASSPIITVPTKTYDGGSHSSLHRDGDSFDPFRHYSDDKVRMDELMMRGDGTAPLEQQSSGSDSGASGSGVSARNATTRPEVNRKTAISFELHHSVFSFDDTRNLHGTTGRAR